MRKTVLSLVVALMLGWSGAVYADLLHGAKDYQAPDYATALRDFRKAVDQGEADAQYFLGVMYDNGQGVTQDYAEAAKWYRRAADQGLAKAQVNLGGMYLLGRGVARDDGEAFVWYRRAADQGHAEAQSYLGAMYVRGRGVAQDYVIAHMWLNIAATSGHSDAEKVRDLLAKQMTPADIAKAQKLAREWMEKHPRQ